MYRKYKNRWCTGTEERADRIASVFDRLSGGKKSLTLNRLVAVLRRKRERQVREALTNTFGVDGGTDMIFERFAQLDRDKTGCIERDAFVERAPFALGSPSTRSTRDYLQARSSVIEVLELALPKPVLNGVLKIL